jgi:hypothetical protein
MCRAGICSTISPLSWYSDMDRENAIRLLEALMAAGKHSAPMAKAWIKKRAWEIGLEGQELVGALAYAANEGWIADGPREDWVLLTSTGAATMRDLMRARQR